MRGGQTGATQATRLKDKTGSIFKRMFEPEQSSLQALAKQKVIEDTSKYKAESSGTCVAASKVWHRNANGAIRVQSTLDTQKTQIECFYCEKKGHFPRDCRKKNKYMEKVTNSFAIESQVRCRRETGDWSGPKPTGLEQGLANSLIAGWAGSELGKFHEEGGDDRPNHAPPLGSASVSLKRLHSSNHCPPGKNTFLLTIIHSALDTLIYLLEILMESSVKAVLHCIEIPSESLDLHHLRDCCSPSELTSLDYYSWNLIRITAVGESKHR
uniref:CCHC-type domain-containing protein n=1 Tax=Timema genevievae TaxID=629358 RepID=A0A7R9K0A1_TIMGE|nr:unnamed protein product [Timema genevievae]